MKFSISIIVFLFTHIAFSQSINPIISNYWPQSPNVGDTVYLELTSNFPIQISNGKNCGVFQSFSDSIKTDSAILDINFFLPTVNFPANNCFRLDTIYFIPNSTGFKTVKAYWNVTGNNPTTGAFNSPRYACDSLFLTIGSAVGIKEINREKISLFPNPTSGLIKFEIANSAFKSHQFQLYDLKGRLVFEEELKQSKSLDLGHLPSGMYHYRLVSTGGLVKTDKLVITD